MLCSEAIRVNQGSFYRTASLLRCKRWSCEICQPRNRWNVVRAIQRGRPSRMVTLTCKHGLYDTPAEAAQDMVRGLRGLRKALAREWPKKTFPMAVVFEAHEDGFPHMHIAMRCDFIPFEWLSKTWERLTGAYHVRIDYIPADGRIAKYVSKYLGKDLHQFAGCKRWWRTHDYEIDPKERVCMLRFGRSWTTIDTPWDVFVRTIMSDLEFVEVVEERPGYLEWKDWYPR